MALLICIAAVTNTWQRKSGMNIKSKNETSVNNKSKNMTKYNIRLVKSIYTPVEIEAENMHEALKKAFAMMPDTDLDHGDCKYTVDFTPEDYDK